MGLRTNELVLDLGSDGAVGCMRVPDWLLVNHLAGFESSCEKPEGDEARGNVVVDVALLGEGSYGLREWGWDGLRRERIVKERDETDFVQGEMRVRKRARSEDDLNV